MDMCRPFRPRSGACHRCFHLRPSGEASQPGLHAPAGTLPPNPVRILLRFGRIRSILPQGRHRAFRSSVVGPAPRVLSLTPQAAFPSQSDDTLFGASRWFRRLSCFRGHHRAFHPAAFLSDHSLRDGPSPFSPPGCDTGRFQRLLISSFRTAGWRTTTLAHSSNCRLLTDCVHPMFRNPGTRGVTRIRGWFTDSHHFLSRYGPMPLTS